MISTPCLQGKSGIECSDCKDGYFKVDILDKKCEMCLKLGRQNFQYETGLKKNGKNCMEYFCDHNEVQLRKEINPDCATSFNLASKWIVKYFFVYLILYLIVLSIFCLKSLKSGKCCKSEKKSKKKKGVFFNMESEYLSVFININGKNSHSSPWFMNMDISKEFNCFVDKRDIFTLSRVSIFPSHVL